MRLVILAAATFAFSLTPAPARENSAPDESPISAAAVVREINLARENPSLYATFVAEARPFHMIEHGHAVDDLPAVLEFDPASFVLTAFGRINGGTAHGDVEVANRFLNAIFRV